MFDESGGNFSNLYPGDMKRGRETQLDHPDLCDTPCRGTVHDIFPRAPGGLIRDMTLHNRRADCPQVLQLEGSLCRLQVLYIPHVPDGLLAEEISLLARKSDRI